MSRYMKIILMYDLPFENEKNQKEYGKFHKKIIKRGYIMIQYSIYYKTLNAVTKYDYECKYLNNILPTKGHIRCFVITERQFHMMKILKGSKLINEKINNGERYVKINEDL